MADSDDVQACPECDSASIAPRVHTPHRYYCDRCGHRFDVPVVRARKHGGQTGGLSPAGKAALRYGREEAGE